MAEIGDLKISTVQYITRHFVQENRVVDKRREDPNKIFTETDQRWIIRKINKGAKINIYSHSKSYVVVVFIDLLSCSSGCFLKMLIGCCMYAL